MGRNIRTLLSIAILFGVIFWIVLSYLPSSLVSLPQFSYTSTNIVRLFPVLLLGGFLLFVILQLWLVKSTAASVQIYNEDEQLRQSNSFRLNVNKEIVLTALPIGFTVILAVASFNWWQRLVALP